VTRSSALVLDMDSWALVTDRLPGFRPPAAFRLLPNPLLETTGLDTTGGGTPIADDRRSDDPAGSRPENLTDVLRSRGVLDEDGRVAPPVAAVLGLIADPTRGAVHVDIRTWAGDRAVLAHLAVGAAHGAGLARLQHLGHGVAGDSPSVRDTARVEVSGFTVDATVEQVWRAVPPDIRQAVRHPDPDVVDPGSLAVLPWPESAALLAVLREREGDPRRVPDGVAEHLLDVLGLRARRSTLEDLATRLRGGVDITVTCGSARAEAATTWMGSWLLAGDRLLAVGLQAAPRIPDLTAATSSQREGSDGSSVTLRAVDGPSMRRDLIRVVSEAVGRCHLARQARSAA